MHRGIRFAEVTCFIAVASLSSIWSAGLTPTAEGRLRRNGQRRGRKYRVQVVKVQKGIMGAENPLSLFLIQEKKDKGFFKAFVDLYFDYTKRFGGKSNKIPEFVHLFCRIGDHESLVKRRDSRHCFSSLSAGVQISSKRSAMLDNYLCESNKP